MRQNTALDKMNNKIITLDDISTKNTDELIELSKQGYKLDIQPENIKIN